MCDPEFPVRIKDIFARGHFFEEVTRQHLNAAGFKFAPIDSNSRRPTDCFAGMLMASSSPVLRYRGLAVPASGNANV
jgi:hypothetical protein